MIHFLLSSPKMATLSPPQYHALTTTTATTKLLRSPSSFLKPSPLARFRFSRSVKLNDYGGEEARRIVEEAFSFGAGDDDLAAAGESDGEEDEDETESSLELLLKFVQSMVNKLSKRAKKASRSVLPPAISSQLVSFAVDGLMLLASLSIVKALLEVACTLGGTVFVAILLLRVSWSALSYFQSSGGNPHTPTQPVT